MVPISRHGLPAFIGQRRYPYVYPKRWPSVLQADPPWLIVLSFVLGGVFFVGMDKQGVGPRVGRRIKNETAPASCGPRPRVAGAGVSV